MAETITVKAEVELPRVPNFFHFAGGAGTIDVADITDAGLRELGEGWTAELIENARQRRGMPRDEMGQRE